MSLTVASRVVNERSTAVYKATLQDEDGVAIPLASLSTLTLTLYDKASGSIINSRDSQDVKNANYVTVHATSGLVTWTMQPLDNVVVGSTIPTGGREEHIALFEWTWSAGAKAGKHEVQIDVLQFSQVP